MAFILGVGMKEALKPMVQYGFKQMGLNRVEVCIGTKNAAFIKLVKRLRFMKEGLSREYYCNNNIVEDLICFLLLKKEYKN